MLRSENKLENLKQRQMNSADSKIDQLRNKWKEAKSQNSEKVENRFFHLAHPDVILKRFSIILRDGRQVSFPYSSLPIFDYRPGLMSIISSGWQIEIKGRNLISLLDEFNKEQIVWIKELPSNIDGMDKEIFISEIQLKGMVFDPII